MSQYVAETDAGAEIKGRNQLVDLFASSCKARASRRIGAEYEKVAVRRSDGRAAPFSGPAGIEELLSRLADRYEWNPVVEHDRVVALRGRKAWITLEPGGQLELSGELCETIHCNRAEFAAHIDEIVTVAADLDLAFLGLGMQPISPLDEIEWVPKQRYRIMAPYMRRVGTLGHRMMKQTAGVQVNLDYESEADAIMKMRVGMGLVPLLIAMFANSPLSDGDLNGFLSYRAHIWTDTDPARCGLLPHVFDVAAGFEWYVDVALDVPMYFIVRDGEWIDMTSLTFRRFLEAGHQGWRATLADWQAHLTTLFFEVRMKGYLEIRCIDSQPADMVLSVPALIKGVFYEDDCLLAAWDMVKDWSQEERSDLYRTVPRAGLRARIRRWQLVDLARELIAIARAGLERQNCVNGRGESEALYLERLEDLVRRGACPADRIIEKWKSGWAWNHARLVAENAYGTSSSGA
jgi:glutamate--cysteine ligase